MKHEKINLLESIRKFKSNLHLGKYDNVLRGMIIITFVGLLICGAKCTFM